MHFVYTTWNIRAERLSTWLTTYHRLKAAPGRHAIDSARCLRRGTQECSPWAIVWLR